MSDIHQLAVLAWVSFILYYQTEGSWMLNLTLVGIQSAPDNVSAISKSESTRNTEKTKWKTFFNFDCKNNIKHYFTTVIVLICHQVYLLSRKYVRLCYDVFLIALQLWRCSGTVLKPRYFSHIVFPSFLVLPVGKVLCFGHFGSPLYWNPNESFSMIRIQNPLIHLQVFTMFLDEELLEYCSTVRSS